MVAENQHIINRKNALYEQRYSIRRLAKDIGKTPQAVSQAINCTTHSFTMQKAISAKLGVSLPEFWPELYGPVDANDVVSVTNDIGENNQAI